MGWIWKYSYSYIKANKRSQKPKILHYIWSSPIVIYIDIYIFYKKQLHDRSNWRILISPISPIKEFPKCDNGYFHEVLSNVKISSFWRCLIIWQTFALFSLFAVCGVSLSADHQTKTVHLMRHLVTPTDTSASSDELGLEHWTDKKLNQTMSYTCDMSYNISFYDIKVIEVDKLCFLW